MTTPTEIQHKALLQAVEELGNNKLPQWINGGDPSKSAVAAMWLRGRATEVEAEIASTLSPSQDAPQVTPQAVQVTDGVHLISAERNRQVTAEGWTPEHDAEHDGEELAFAAAVYATPAGHRESLYWPWAEGWWKPTPNDRIRELVKAGALIAAEIDRLNGTAAQPQAQPPQESELLEQFGDAAVSCGFIRADCRNGFVSDVRARIALWEKECGN